jgi:hypothetical protein
MRHWRHGAPEGLVLLEAVAPRIRWQMQPMAVATRLLNLTQ